MKCAFRLKRRESSSDVVQVVGAGGGAAASGEDHNVGKPGAAAGEPGDEDHEDEEGDGDGEVDARPEALHLLVEARLAHVHRQVGVEGRAAGRVEPVPERGQAVGGLTLGGAHQQRVAVRVHAVLRVRVVIHHSVPARL